MNPDLKPGRRVFIETWGCQMNVLDGRRFAGLLARDGYAETFDESAADVFILNTCSVRDKAEQKVYDRVGRLAKLKRERPELVVGVCGCVAQQEGESLLERLPAVDFVLGTGRIETLPVVLRRVREEGDRPCETGFDTDEVVYTPGAVSRLVRHRASLTVIEGCNKNCTFCVVPRTRGRERNRRLARRRRGEPAPARSKASSRSSSSDRPSTRSAIPSPERISPTSSAPWVRCPGSGGFAS